MNALGMNVGALVVDKGWTRRTGEVLETRETRVGLDVRVRFDCSCPRRQCDGSACRGPFQMWTLATSLRVL